MNIDIVIINLPTSTNRYNFQVNQFNKLQLPYQFISAVAANDVTESMYNKYYKQWQRPLRKTEIACYLSHRKVWQQIINNNMPALILEDDALIANNVAEIFNNIDLIQYDLINLETRCRKKFVSNKALAISNNYKAYRLYQDRTGAAGYVLAPTGAKKLLRHEKQQGIGLADAHITSCTNLLSYQVEPAPIIQLDCAKYYQIHHTYTQETKTIIGLEQLNANSFIFKRIVSQLRLGLRQLILLFRGVKRRFIKIDQNYYKITT